MPAALHIHSWFSLLEGTASPEMLVRRAHEAGYTSLALTDTNNLYGVVPFLAEATRVGIRPVVGAHLRHGGHRAVALAADANGYRSLCRLLSAINTTSPPNPLSEAERGSRKSIASAEGRADRTHQAKPNKRGAHLPAGEAMLLRLPLSAQRGSGGVSPPAHSGRGLGGEVATHATGLHILTDDIPLAESLRDAFPGRLWLEVIRPGSRGPEVLAAARRLGLRVVASTAAHMLDEADHPTHRLVTAVRRVTLLDRVTSTPATPRHRLVSAAELRHLFRDMPEAVANGEELASMLRSDVLPTRLVVPEPRTQHRLDLVRYLRALCERGLRERDMGDDLKARARLRRELQIIEANGLPGYFLTVRDIANLARKGGHTMALRGSAGNSLVCYLLGITDVDPLRFGLELERFLHPGRVDLPDIDLDFDWKVRDEIIDKVIRRHGAAHAVRICMQLFFQPRSAFREAGKVHGLSNEQVSEMLTALDERVDSIVIPEPGAPDPPCPRAFPLEPQRWPRMVADARRLLGRPMHPSLHPGGIVITPRPVSDYVPLEWSAKGLLMTQYDKDAIEAIGLVKIDLLGNRALSTVDEAIRHIPSVVPKSVDCHDDPATVDLLRRGDTVGITQLESPAMRHLLIPMRPRGLDDVIQALALLRPGAASIGMKDTFIRRRNGRERTPAAHPLLERVLGETHGLMLYEDDSLRVLQALTGMDAAEADRFRKRIAKHRTPEEAEALRREFLAATSPPPPPSPKRRGGSHKSIACAEGKCARLLNR